MFSAQGYETDALKTILRAQNYDLNASIEFIMQMNESGAPSSGAPPIESEVKPELLGEPASSFAEEPHEERSAFDESPSPQREEPSAAPGLIETGEGAEEGADGNAEEEERKNKEMIDQMLALDLQKELDQEESNMNE